MYDHSLEAFSNPLMQLVDYDLDDLGQMSVQGESGALFPGQLRQNQEGHPGEGRHA